MDLRCLDDAQQKSVWYMVSGDSLCVEVIEGKSLFILVLYALPTRMARGLGELMLDP